MSRKKAIEKPPAEKALDEIKAVVGRAKLGDASVLPRLRELLSQYPELWRRYGDLAAQAEAGWASLALRSRWGGHTGAGVARRDTTPALRFVWGL